MVDAAVDIAALTKSDIQANVDRFQLISCITQYQFAESEEEAASEKALLGDHVWSRVGELSIE